MSDAKAASIAKNISVNFNRKGSITTKAGAYFAFFNAAVQGTARTVETLRGPKGKQLIASGVGIGAAMTAMAIAAMGEDEYEKIPEFVRERSLIIPLGDADYVAIPMPLGFHILPNIGRKAVEIAMGSNRISATERMAQLAGSTVSAFNPLGGNGVDTFVPTVLDPVVALWRNKDWTGRAIYKEDFNSLDPTLGFTRKKDTASGISSTLAEFINKASGGTDYKQGIMSPTPDQLDYAFGAVFGGTGREALKFEQSAEALMTGNLAELPAHKIPLVGRLYGKAEGPSVERGLYYENLKRLNEHEAEIAGLRSEQGGAAKAAKYIWETPEARLVPQGKAIEKIIDGLMRRRKKLKATNPNAPGLRIIEQRIEFQQKRLNDLVAAAA
ncbi:LPD38 domain-containing protein [Methylobacter sp. Wu1]|uniref:LPD38 domain-containing protein n=1 Tax=Methylobacter sp. Wu1 TaxID=3119359 RepID=UPI002F93A8C0